MKHRTALVTVASVMVVIFAATAAIAANLGILSNATDTGEIGALTVASSSTTAIVAETPSATIAQVEDTSPQTTSTSSTEPPAPTGDLTAYAVAEAGVVTLSNDGTNLTVADLQPNDGWQTAVIPSERGVEIGFVGSDGSVLLFAAQLNPDGTIQTLVEDLQAANTTQKRSDDEDDDNEGEDDDD